jgi:hypothetical protein
MFRKIVLGIALISLAGCATLFDGKYQQFTVNTVNDKVPKATRCVLKNEEGEWRTWANISTVIHRDGNVMSIDCENEEQAGNSTIDSRFQAEYLILDILWDWCIITASCIIDGATNAFFEYPYSASVEMKSKQEVQAVRPAVQETKQEPPVAF